MPQVHFIQTYYLQVKRHRIFKMDISQGDLALIQSGDHPDYLDIDDWAQDQDLSDPLLQEDDEEWVDSEVEVQLVEQATA